MAKKKQRKMSFRGQVKAGISKSKNNGGRYNVFNTPDGVELYKPKAGDRDIFDIIPYIVTVDNHPDKDTSSFEGITEEIAHKGGLSYRRPYKVHKDVGADNKTVICLKSFGKKCPICEYRQAQLDKGKEWEEVKYLKEKDRILYILKPVEINKAKDSFYLMDISYHLFQKKLEQEIEEDEEYLDFPNLEGGLSLRVRWIEGNLSKKGQEYCEAGPIKFLERDEDYGEDILDEVPCLDDLLIEISYDKMKALFFEDDVDNSEEDEEENETPFKEDAVEKPVKKKTTKKKAKKEPEPKPEPEEEIDWDALEAMDLEDLADACNSYDLDAEEIIDDEEDEGKSAVLLRKALAEELDIEIPKPASKKKATKKESASKKKSTKKDTHKCPIEEGEFGVTTDEFEECDDCPLLEACINKNEEG